MRILLLSTFLLLASCSSSDILKGALGLGGGGPNVNAQVGKENTQQVVLGNQVKGTQNNERVKAERVDTVIVNETIPPWVLLLLILGWLLPSPSEMGRGLMKLFRRNK